VDWPLVLHGNLQRFLSEAILVSEKIDFFEGAPVRFSCCKSMIRFYKLLAAIQYTSLRRTIPPSSTSYQSVERKYGKCLCFPTRNHGNQFVYCPPLLHLEIGKRTFPTSVPPQT
jgi:hypothetical protein